MDNLELKKMANQVRKGIVTAVHSAKAGHPGGSLSAADIYTFLYFEEMNVDPKDPKKADRDRFVLSKGHTAPGLYSTLANKGYFLCSDSWFDQYVFQAAIEKEYLGDLAALAAQPPIALEPWDPMGTLAD